MTRKIPIRKGGKTEGYQKALYRSLVTDLLGYEKIVTTEAKAKRIRPLAEKIITLGKAGTLHSRRQALAYIYDEKVTEKVFSELAQRYAGRAGGYTRIIKLALRVGDGALLSFDDGLGWRDFFKEFGVFYWLSDYFVEYQCFRYASIFGNGIELAGHPLWFYDRTCPLSDCLRNVDFI